ncbi:MAG TPA: hypothetical protein VFA20_10895 [Myxococcaceae bacterium]|nr:hypothetical protein [Myxococcaceae bacterium]
MIRRLAPLAALLAATSFAQQPTAAASSPDAEDKALEDAFAAPGSKAPPPPPGKGKMDADVPPPKVGEQAAETEEERAERELGAKLDAAGEDAEFAALARPAAALGPLMTLQLMEKWAMTSASTHAPAAGAHARAWLLACGPGSSKEVARCRAKALDTLRDAGPAFKAEATRLEEADHCVASAAPGDHACLPKAIAAYKKSRDRLMLARATLAGLEPEDEAKRRAALKLCPEPRCASLRAGVLEQLASDELQKNAAEQAARDALEAVKLRQSALPASLRLYARTDALDRACAAYDHQTSPGKCRVLERQVLGGYVFHDYSRTSRDTLPSSTAREATDHYAVLLTSCLQEFGEKSGSGRYKLSWTILNDGHVTNVDAVNVDPQGQLIRCLKSQFAHWRYPRYKGEWQHVEQEFRVGGTAR